MRQLAIGVEFHPPLGLVDHDSLDLWQRQRGFARRGQHQTCGKQRHGGNRDERAAAHRPIS
jgi:hypothetical protein